MQAALAALLLLQAVGGRARWATSPCAAPSFVAAPHAHLSKVFAPARRRPALPFRSARRARTYGLQHLGGVSRDDNLRRADHVTGARNCDAPLRRRAEACPRRRLIRRRRPATDAAAGAVCVRTTSPASRGPAKLRRSPATAAARPQHASRQCKTAESLFISFIYPPPYTSATDPALRAGFLAQTSRARPRPQRPLPSSRSRRTPQENYLLLPVAPEPAAEVRDRIGRDPERLELVVEAAEQLSRVVEPRFDDAPPAVARVGREQGRLADHRRRRRLALAPRPLRRRRFNGQSIDLC